jgi:hypothetical protein
VRQHRGGVADHRGLPLCTLQRTHRRRTGWGRLRPAGDARHARRPACDRA